MNERGQALAARVQEVVDAGRDMEETEPSLHRQKKPRVYRKTVPYSYAEALQIAVKALEAYFVEQPRFIGSCLDTMAHAELAARAGRDRSPFDGDPETRDQEKQVQVELRTETQILESSEDVFTLHRAPVENVREQEANLVQLRKLIDFGEE
jgi:hypothetical protein